MRYSFKYSFLKRAKGSGQRLLVFPVFATLPFQKILLPGIYSYGINPGGILNKIQKFQQ